MNRYKSPNKLKKKKKRLNKLVPAAPRFREHQAPTVSPKIGSNT